MQFFRTPNINFIQKRRTAYVISGVLVLFGIVSIFNLNLGIDFKGGTSIVLQFEDKVTVSELRNALAVGDFGNIEIKHFGSRNEVLIYVEQKKDVSAQEMAVKVESAIQEVMPDKEYQRIKYDTVGPKIGEELRKSAVLAILFALFLILIYIGWRFELVFAIGAIIALFHDVLITIGIFTMLNFELSLKEIAAFLTIVGYSLNDTIVVYDRIRENLKILRSEDLGAIINRSINQCLSRTVVTSLTTFVVVAILFIIGGGVIRGFAFAMMVGVVVGTYSSIFVASPLVLEWQSRHGGKGKLRMIKRKRK
ncbi:protein translocase subunit SecF [bacterium]|nr:protein translocase subunit SecF [bacterium]RQV98215.1 MAG: protein translocase subunit SecF [bacterium]